MATRARTRRPSIPWLDIFLSCVVAAALIVVLWGFYEANKINIENAKLDPSPVDDIPGLTPADSLPTVKDGVRVSVSGYVRPSSLRRLNESVEPYTAEYGMPALVAFQLKQSDGFDVIVAPYDMVGLSSASMWHDKTFVDDNFDNPIRPPPSAADEGYFKELKDFLRAEQTFSGIVRHRDGRTFLVVKSGAANALKRKAPAAKRSETGPLAYSLVGGVVAFLGAVALRASRQRRQIVLTQRERRAQLAGESCADCDKDIVREIDATACEECSAPIHRGTCHTRHVTQAHSSATTTAPYRSS